VANKDSTIPEKKWKPPAFFENIDWKKGESEKYGEEDMWSEDEVLMAIQACDHPRDKAIIALGYDVAGRPIELNRMRIKDVIFKNNYTFVKLVDHTGTRYPPLTFSYEYVLSWINCHPLKDESEAPLWVRVDTIPKKMEDKWIWRLLVQRVKPKLKHKIHKPFNPYNVFDHSRLSNLADNGFSDTELKKFRNWSINSKMPKRYIHMKGEKVTDKLLALHGMKQLESEVKEPVLQAKICYRCKEKNPIDARYCVKCNFILSPEAFEEIKQREVEKDKEFESMREQFKEFKAGMDLIRPVINQLAKEAKTKEFTFASPDGKQVYKLTTEQIAKLIEGKD